MNQGFFLHVFPKFFTSGGVREVLGHMDESMHLVDYFKYFSSKDMIFANPYINHALVSYSRDLCSSMETWLFGRVSMPRGLVIVFSSLSLNLLRDHYQEVVVGNKCHGDVNPTRTFGLCGKVESFASSTWCSSLVPKTDDREYLSSLGFHTSGFIGRHLTPKELQGGGLPVVKWSIGRKHRWVVKPHGGEVSLVVGGDLQVSQITDLDSCVVVGKFSGRRDSMESLHLWMQEEWKPTLDYVSMVHLLSRGWIGFLFLFKEDAHKILRGRWY
jgi:hypothetical protein